MAEFDSKLPKNIQAPNFKVGYQPSQPRINRQQAVFLEEIPLLRARIEELEAELSQAKEKSKQRYNELSSVRKELNETNEQLDEAKLKENQIENDMKVEMKQKESEMKYFISNHEKKYETEKQQHKINVLQKEIEEIKMPKVPENEEEKNLFYGLSRIRKEFEIRKMKMENFSKKIIEEFEKEKLILQELYSAEVREMKSKIKKLSSMTELPLPATKKIPVPKKPKKK